MGEEKTEPRFELREKPVVASQFSRSKAQWGHSDSHTEHVRGAVVAGQYSEPAHTDQGTSDSIRLSRTVELYVSRTGLRCTCGLECVKSNSNYMGESAEAGWGGDLASQVWGSEKPVFAIQLRQPPAGGYIAWVSVAATRTLTASAQGERGPN